VRHFALVENVPCPTKACSQSVSGSEFSPTYPSRYCSCRLSFFRANLAERNWRSVVGETITRIDRIRYKHDVGVDTAQKASEVITFLSRQALYTKRFSLCDMDQRIRISMKTNWRKCVRVERTDDIRDAVRRF
jgi:hypothetical protein